MAGEALAEPGPQQKPGPPFRSSTWIQDPKPLHHPALHSQGCQHGGESEAEQDLHLHRMNFRQWFEL